MDHLLELHGSILRCTRCADLGYIERAAPVVDGGTGSGLMLIGQAPGVTELNIRRPFSGRAGKELFRWMDSIGITEDEFRHGVYMTSITKCFPGRVAGGTGDRRPSRRETDLCRPWLEAQIALVRPHTLLLIGGMAIERYLPRSPLDTIIGQQFQQNGRRLIPLPHPSGASRWLNVPAHKDLLRDALLLVRAAWVDALPPIAETG